MAFEANSGISRLALTLSRRMKQENESDEIIDFGKIQKNMSLVTDAFPVPIAKGEYLVLSHGEERVKPGDRVLVAWVGNEAVVMGRINES